MPRACTRRRLLILLAALLLSPQPCAGDEPMAPPAVPVHAALIPLRPWLRHEDWTVRSIAAFDLRQRTEPGVVHIAAILLRREKHAYVAAAALGALRARPRRELVMEGGELLVEALLRWAEHTHPTVRSYAREVLRAVPPVRLGNDLVRYRGWWQRGRDALLREQRALLAESAATHDDAGGPPGAASTSAEADRGDDRFYGRLEQMRRHGLELCIVMDHTGSMGPVIGAAKAGARRLLSRLRAYIPRFRAGLVTYDDGARVRCMLTDDDGQLTKALRKVGAGGGADPEEGVDKGIALALAQDRMGWSRSAYRVIVVVGDAPPHEADIPRLMRQLQAARQDLLYQREVVVHTVSTDSLPVLHFPQIALAGGGNHVTLQHSSRLVEELVQLTFGGVDRERVQAWMQEIDALRRAEADSGPPQGKNRR